ncbi:MAG: 50S ribosomal protein L7ae [Gracilibacteraceae bacterium]|jgi:ribosomal protein L7Ae-like RNA K-turn-binding protein|nr:50S ribosomal protein L7ae [Gracilibacteraceae bacterium]
MNKVYSMISLAYKAGKLLTGEDAVRNSIRSGRVRLIIISEDASDNTKKHIGNSAAFYNVPCIIWGMKNEFGSCIGKSARSVLGITDENFGSGISDKLIDEVRKKEKPGGGFIE